MSRSIVRWLALAVLTFAFPRLPNVGAQPLPEHGRLEGTVKSNGVPLAGATVIVRRTEVPGNARFWGVRIATDQNGHFAVPNIEDGNYSVLVGIDGYTEGNIAIHVAPGMDDVRFDLQPLATISLHVLKSGDKPLANAPVIVLLPPGNGVAGDSYRGYRLVTDAGGNVAVPRVLPPGKSYFPLLLAGAAGYGAPGALEATIEGGAIPVHLQPGATLHLQVKETGTGKPVGGAIPVVTSIQFEASLPIDSAQRNALRGALEMYVHHVVTSDATGQTSIAGLIPGRYGFKVTQTGYAAEERSVELKSQATVPLEVNLNPQWKTTGLDVALHDQSGKPIAHCEVSFLVSTPSEVADGVPLPATLLRHGRTDAAGHLTLYPLWPAKWYVSWMTSGTDGFLLRIINENTIGQDQVNLLAPGASVAFTVFEKDRAKLAE